MKQNTSRGQGTGSRRTKQQIERGETYLKLTNLGKQPKTVGKMNNTGGRSGPPKRPTKPKRVAILRPADQMPKGVGKSNARPAPPRRKG